MSTFPMNAKGALEFEGVVEHDVEAPYVRCRTSGSSAWIAISLDPPSTWPNGIFENSRYVRLSVSPKGTIGLVTDSGLIGKFSWRKTKASSFEDVVVKINRYLKEVR